MSAGEELGVGDEGEVRVRTRAWLPVVVVAMVVSGCASSAPAPRVLNPAGPHLDGPAEVRVIGEDPATQGTLQEGDRIVAIGDIPVGSLNDFFMAMQSDAQTVVVSHLDGSQESVPRDVIQDSSTGHLKFLPIGPGETVVVPTSSLYSSTHPAGLFFLGPMSGSVASVVWPTEREFAEVILRIEAPERCQDCELLNVALMDWGSRNWLQPVNPELVALSLYPKTGQAPPPIPVPPPTEVGSVATSQTTGSVTANSFGNTLSGNLSATTTTTETPIYDYSATNMAAAYNLGAAIAQAQLRAHEGARREFLYSREGNLQLGSLLPGQSMFGYIHFYLPAWVEGPLVAFLYGTAEGEDQFAVVRFGG